MAHLRLGDTAPNFTAVSDEEAQKRFPGFKKIKPYLRITKTDNLI